VRDVEAQPIGGDQRTLLRDMLAEAIPQRRVKQVRRGVIGADRAPPRSVHAQVYGVAECQRAFVDARVVDVQSGQQLGGVRHCPARTVAGDRPRISDLAAALRVEGRLVNHHEHVGARFRAVDAPAVLHQRHHLRLGLFGGVAQELGRASVVGDFEPDVVGRAFARTLPRGAGGALSVRPSRGCRTGSVDAEALRAQRVFGQVVGKAERVVELERGLARQRRPGLMTPVAPSSRTQAVGERLTDEGLLQASVLRSAAARDQLG
jgi:hypothetical protein